MHLRPSLRRTALQNNKNQSMLTDLNFTVKEKRGTIVNRKEVEKTAKTVCLREININISQIVKNVESKQTEAVGNGKINNHKVDNTTSNTMDTIIAIDSPKSSGPLSDNQTILLKNTGNAQADFFKGRTKGKSREEYITVGDWCLFRSPKNNILAGKILSFSYLSAPILPPRSNIKGLGRLGSWFQIANDGELEWTAEIPLEFYNIHNYVSKPTPTRNYPVFKVHKLSPDILEVTESTTVRTYSRIIDSADGNDSLDTQVKCIAPYDVMR
ncbi:hypothetical protein FQR65_LT16826 [Abscondita terminalis]|nr:hypothetical protein FQR65_LT16826 [Abscondita terminalis]